MSVLPVMVFIHGGGFLTGSGNIGIHGADRFLDNGVILVTINYRLNVFGKNKDISLICESLNHEHIILIV